MKQHADDASRHSWDGPQVEGRGSAPVHRHMHHAPEGLPCRLPRHCHQSRRSPTFRCLGASWMWEEGCASPKKQEHPQPEVKKPLGRRTDGGVVILPTQPLRHEVICERYCCSASQLQLSPQVSSESLRSMMSRTTMSAIWASSSVTCQSSVHEYVAVPSFGSNSRPRCSL